MSMKDELASLDDIAEMYRVTRRYARDFIVKRPGFPVRIAGSTVKRPLWLKSSLREYMAGSCRTNLANQ